MVEQTMQPGIAFSAVARLHGVLSRLLAPWRRSMAEGGQKAVRANEEFVPIGRVLDRSSAILSLRPIRLPPRAARTRAREPQQKGLTLAVARAVEPSNGGRRTRNLQDALI
ncbi:hypothetical protein GCM10011320_57520 [Neoroseomonas lacus]|uniref:Uncharacterized protein n=1 Tax=Neoroseomonas lacus TaxID=287609 RepID=A0A917L3D7_9PROT|nr:hypothetical protein GCM10011320_57520 [Neoroseomonas lacus]